LRCIPRLYRAPAYRDAINALRRERGQTTRWLEPNIAELCIFAFIAAAIGSSYIR
jgi:hypothetical protein